jgi:hypothetical protein
MSPADRIGPAEPNRGNEWMPPGPNDLRELERKHQARANGRLILGIVIGATLAIGATAYFAQEAGSFAGAGEQADRRIDAAATDTNELAADTARSVGDAARAAGDSVDGTMSKAADKVEKQ